MEEHKLIILKKIQDDCSRSFTERKKWNLMINYHLDTIIRRIYSPFWYEFKLDVALKYCARDDDSYDYTNLSNNGKFSRKIIKLAESSLDKGTLTLGPDTIRISKPKNLFYLIKKSYFFGKLGYKLKFSKLFIVEKDSSIDYQKVIGDESNQIGSLFIGINDDYKGGDFCLRKFGDIENSFRLNNSTHILVLNDYHYCVNEIKSGTLAFAQYDIFFDKNVTKAYTVNPSNQIEKLIVKASELDTELNSKIDENRDQFVLESDSDENEEDYYEDSESSDDERDVSKKDFKTYLDFYPNHLNQQINLNYLPKSYSDRLYENLDLLREFISKSDSSHIGIITTNLYTQNNIKPDDLKYLDKIIYDHLQDHFEIDLIHVMTEIEFYYQTETDCDPYHRKGYNNLKILSEKNPFSDDNVEIFYPCSSKMLHLNDRYKIFQQVSCNTAIATGISSYYCVAMIISNPNPVPIKKKKTK